MSAEVMCRDAARMQQEGRVGEAEALFRQALQADAGHYPSLMLLGHLCLRQERAEEALKLFARALTHQPQMPGVHAARAMALKQLGRPQEALSAYDEAVRHDSSNAAIWNNRGNILVSLDRQEEALDSFDRAVALKADFLDAHFNRGNALQSLERYEEALASYAKADSGNARMRNNRGAILLSQGHPQEALADIDAALALDPDFTLALHNRGNALAKLNRLPEALAAFDAALTHEPHNAGIWNNRGRALMNGGLYEDAITAFSEAVALHADQGEALVCRGKCLCILDRTDEGFADFRRAGAFRTPGKDVAHKRKHDAEQRAYLSDAVATAGSRIAGPAINPRNDMALIGEQWEASQPQMVVIDNLLTPEALEALRRHCMSAKVWEHVFEGGYLGATPYEGFAPPLLAQIADELRGSYPQVFGIHTLNYHWAFKYDSSLSGIHTHADTAAVNVNFWITPDDANLDPDHGGLVVWDKAAPREWDFDTMNGNLPAIREFLAQSGAKPITVPYRANRAVIFDSDLFHQTDTIRFKEGYENRRINITLLYGRREET